MKNERTIAEAVKIILDANNDGLTDVEIYNQIIQKGLYEFGAKIRYLRFRLQLGEAVQG